MNYWVDFHMGGLTLHELDVMPTLFEMNEISLAPWKTSIWPYPTSKSPWQ